MPRLQFTLIQSLRVQNKNQKRKGQGEVMRFTQIISGLESVEPSVKSQIKSFENTLTNAFHFGFRCKASVNATLKGNNRYL
jgi:hypothetical protein